MPGGYDAPQQGMTAKSMFRKRPGLTRTGLVYTYPEERPDVRDELLYDFDIDDDELKEEHKKHLAQTMRWMVDHLSERQQSVKFGDLAWKVSIDGFASRTGAVRHNDILSVMREQSVAAYFNYYLAMKPELAKQVKIDTRFHGFRDTPVPGENPLYRSARVVIHRPSFVPQPRPIPPLPPEPGAARIFHFRMRVAPEQPNQPGDINKALSTALDVAKTVAKLKTLQELLEKLQKAVPKISALARTGDFLKYFKIALGALGVEFIGFDIMDSQTRRGARYVYFGLAPSTDFLVDMVADLIIDNILGFISTHHNLPLEGDAEKALVNLLAKLGLKDVAGRIKKLFDLELKPPFPFTPFTAASLPIVGIFFVGLDDFQGAFSEQRTGGTLTVMFEEGIGAQRPVNTSPPHIKLVTGATGISLRFGLTGVIAKGADIPFEA